MPHPIYIALLGIAVMSLWGVIWPIGVLLVGYAAMRI